MKIRNYIKEIQYRVFFWGYSIFFNFFIFYCYREEILFLLGQHQPKTFPYFIATNLTEAFLATIKLIVFLGMYCSIPILIFQIWVFIIPALYYYEYKKVKKLILFSVIIFVISCYVAYYILIPYSWKFFLGFELGREKTGVSIHLEIRLNDYLNFFIDIFIVLNLGFHISLFIFLILQKLTLNYLIRFRKLLFFLFFLIATIITPPDLESQMVIGFSLIVFYELMLFSFFLSAEYKKIKLGE